MIAACLEITNCRNRLDQLFHLERDRSLLRWSWTRCYGRQKDCILRRRKRREKGGLHDKPMMCRLLYLAVAARFDLFYDVFFVGEVVERDGPVVGDRFVDDWHGGL